MSQVNILNSTIFGSTAMYSGPVYTYGNIEGESEIIPWCPETQLIFRSARYPSLPNIVGEIERDMSTLFTAECISFNEDQYTSYTLRNNDYIYYMSSSGGIVYITEYNLSSLEKVSIIAVPTTPTEYHVQYGIIGERKIGLIRINDAIDNYDVYELDFATEISELVHQFPRYWSVDDYEYCSYANYSGLCIWVNYNNKIFAIMVNSGDRYYVPGPPYNEDGGAIWNIYNHTDSIAEDPIFKVNHSSRRSDWAPIWGMLGYYQGKLLCLATDIDFYDASLMDGTAFHTFNLATTTANSIFLNSGEGWETNHDYLAIDQTNGIAYCQIVYQDQSMDDTICKYDFSTDTAIIWKTSAYWFSLCAGNETIYIFDEADNKWYDINWNVVLTIIPPVNGYNNVDNLSYAFSDIEQRIWWYDNTISPRLIGARITDSDIREILVTVTYPTISPHRMYVMDLGDMFILLKSKNADSKNEFFTVRTA